MGKAEIENLKVEIKAKRDAATAAQRRTLDARRDEQVVARRESRKAERAAATRQAVHATRVALAKRAVGCALGALAAAAARTDGVPTCLPLETSARRWWWWLRL